MYLFIVFSFAVVILDKFMPQKLIDRLLKVFKLK